MGWLMKIGVLSKLSTGQQRSFIERLRTRRIMSRALMDGRVGDDLVLVVGDTPGPGAPKINGYHHTPFYATVHCSGWLNLLLEEAAIPESGLVWINSTNVDGNPAPVSALDHNFRGIIALGGNAEKWLKKSGVTNYVKVHHPQFWKRFHSKEAYPLIEQLKRFQP